MSRQSSGANEFGPKDHLDVSINYLSPEATGYPLTGGLTNPSVPNFNQTNTSILLSNPRYEAADGVLS